MECNKEEAIRAKAIAEKKMESKDFVGARKIAHKAQRLYPDLENISQIICVCDVHCSAENRMFGNEDWYGILQIEQSADDALIKKQYRKLALLLHPDKNKFAGAEAAFKLIGEAQRMLLDKGKRSFYDMKLKTSSRTMAPSPTSQANRNSNAVRQPQNHNNFYGKTFSSMAQQPKKKAQSAVSNGKETFWTRCPFCSISYQYYKNVLHKSVLCQSCIKSFVAYDSYPGRMPAGTNVHQSARYTPVEVPNKGLCRNPSNSRFQGSSSQKMSGLSSFPKAGQSTKVGGSQKTSDFDTVANKNNIRGCRDSNRLRKENGRRGKKRVVESSESIQSESSTDSEVSEAEKYANVAGFGLDNESHRRRSVRSKRHVSYNEDESEDEGILNSLKRTKCDAHSFASNGGIPSREEPTNLTNQPSFAGEIGRRGIDKANRNDHVADDNLKRSSRVDDDAASMSNPDISLETHIHDVPDSDFNDFDKDRKEDCFKVGQIWAVYDIHDAMPRFYARIRKVFSPGFKLRITWLEPDPDEVGAQMWVEKELPFSCGKFMHGSSENTNNCLMFSHPISWEKRGKDSIKIYPKKGETWALFKNWHVEWMSNPDNDRKYEYDFVEILSGYDESVGIHVAYLGKLKGFTCLFCRKVANELQIPHNEILRFSHRVPSYRMTGKEREDVPNGSFELDPASIPLNLEEMALPPEVKSVIGADESAYQSDYTDIHDNHQNISDFADHASTQTSPPDEYRIPDPEFFNFDATKTLDKFQVGQVWALYSDVDGLPKYYGLIKKADLQPEFRLKVAWLEPCSLPSNLITWRNRKMPICCGRFKTKIGRLQSYTDLSCFSHQLRADTAKRKMYEIYPHKGEIWALYKDWNVDMTPHDLENCDYDIVEIVEENVNDSYTKVLVLEHVPDYTSVFKVQMNGNCPVTLEIHHTELLRFSHQIPFHDLTEEKCGSLRGFKELDTAALSMSFLDKKR